MGKSLVATDLPGVPLRPNRDAHQLLFRTIEDKKVLSQKLFWIAVVSAFVIANAPPAKISAGLFRVLEILPSMFSRDLLPVGADMQRVSQQITRHAEFGLSADKIG
jgi:hypothetical protein